MRSLVGTRWRGASGDVFTVEQHVGMLVYGRWDSGALWTALVSDLPKLYVEVDGGPIEELPR